MRNNKRLDKIAERLGILEREDFKIVHIFVAVDGTETEGFETIVYDNNMTREQIDKANHESMEKFRARLD